MIHPTKELTDKQEKRVRRIINQGVIKNEDLGLIRSQMSAISLEIEDPEEDENYKAHLKNIFNELAKRFLWKLKEVFSGVPRYLSYDLVASFVISR